MEVFASYRDTACEELIAVTQTMIGSNGAAGDENGADEESDDADAQPGLQALYQGEIRVRKLGWQVAGVIEVGLEGRQESLGSVACQPGNVARCQAKLKQLECRQYVALDSMITCPWISSLVSARPLLLNPDREPSSEIGKLLQRFNIPV